jgi:hypothetical protein
MSSGQAIALYLASAVPCLLVTALLVRWGRPVGGQLSPRLQQRGMETVVAGTASFAAIVGVGFVVGAVLEVTK